MTDRTRYCQDCADYERENARLEDELMIAFDCLRDYKNVATWHEWRKRLIKEYDSRRKEASNDNG